MKFALVLLFLVMVITKHQVLPEEVDIQDCIVERKGLQHGFHGQIETTLTLSKSHYGLCTMLIIERLPSAVFVDMYQLQHEQNFGGPQVYSSSAMDLESPEYLAVPMEIYLWKVFDSIGSDGSMNSTISMPVHFRYHRPVPEGKVKVAVNYPKIMLKCSEFPGELLPSGVDAYAPCSNENPNNLCVWKELSCAKSKEQQNSVIFALPTPVPHLLDFVFMFGLFSAITAAISLCVLIVSRDLLDAQLPRPTDTRACGDSMQNNH